MAEVNPYQATETNLESEQALEYSDVKILSAQGRIGRLRYLAYSMVLMIVSYIVIGVVALVSTLLPEAAGKIILSIGMLVAYVGLIVVAFLIAIQRVHDFNYSGWFSILMLVPLVGLLLLFVPGTDRANNYGNPPPPNNKLVLIGGLILPIIAFIGVIAAIAIPAYQGYIQAAQQAAGQ